MKAKWEKGVDAMVNERREGRGSLRFIERKKEGKERKKEKSGKQQKKQRVEKQQKQRVEKQPHPPPTHFSSLSHLQASFCTRSSATTSVYFRDFFFIVSVLAMRGSAIQ